MNYKKFFKRDLEKIKTPDIGTILPGYSEKQSVPRSRRGLRRIAIMPLTLILACVLIIGVAAAAGVPLLIKYLNAGVLTDNNMRLDEVPEGWVGVYTLEDLDAIRLDTGANYILMNDINITDADYAPGGICEGGWVPIVPSTTEITETLMYGDVRTYTIKEFGEFNGNGYVIRNLKISTPGAPDNKSIGGFANSLATVGLFGDAMLSVRNLGIEGCEIVIDNFDAYNIVVGAIAGNTDFLGGCYATGVTIDITIPGVPDEAYDGYINETPPSASIGGIGGYVKYVDSCYSDAVITIRTADQTSYNFELRAGGVAGLAYSGVTSYSNGRIDAALELFANDSNDSGVLGRSFGMPTLVSEDVMEIIKEKLAQTYGKDTFEYKKAQAFYILKAPAFATNDESRREIEQFIEDAAKSYYFTDDVSAVKAWYVFDPWASIKDETLLVQLYSDAFGGREAFMAFCFEQNIKCGVIYCYGFADGRVPGEADLPMFDFENIWTIKDGEARLRIFES